MLEIISILPVLKAYSEYLTVVARCEDYLGQVVEVTKQISVNANFH